jgi:hypothetical protein
LARTSFRLLWAGLRLLWFAWGGYAKDARLARQLMWGHNFVSFAYRAKKTNRMSQRRVGLLAFLPRRGLMLPGLVPHGWSVTARHPPLDRDTWESLRDRLDYPPLEKAKDAPQASDSPRELPDMDWSLSLPSGSMYVLVAVVAIAVLWAAWRWRDVLLASGAAKTSPAVGAPGDEEGAPLDPEWERRLQEAESAGDYRLALRWWYLGSLRVLAEAGRVQPAPDKTPAAFCRELAATELARPFTSLSTRYQMAWFGAMEPDEEEYRRYRGYFKKFIKQARA